MLQVARYFWRSRMLFRRCRRFGNNVQRIFTILTTFNFRWLNSNNRATTCCHLSNATSRIQGRQNCRNDRQLLAFGLSQVKCLQCYDADGWTAGRAAIRPLSSGVQVWLSDWSEAQTRIWSSWCHCHPRVLPSVKSRFVLPIWYRLTCSGSSRTNGRQTSVVLALLSKRYRLSAASTCCRCGWALILSAR